MDPKPKYEISWKLLANSNGIRLVMWREEQTTVGQSTPGNALWTHKEPRKTKDEIEVRFR